MVKVSQVAENSTAQKNGIQDGDILISINGNEINDVLDYKFYIFENKINLKIKRNVDVFSVDIKKPQYDDIGLEFETYIMDNKKSCKNKCIFCFIDQLPKNCLRETLYFKDDDERLSFLHGNYITLTNLEDWHIARIIKMRISPVNISVHTTNPELRVKMMNNKRAGEVLKYIKKLDENNVNINAQIVLCKNINDGKELERTITDLCAMSSIQSIAVVPSGLTKHREENGLCKLEPFDKSDCENIIKQVNKFGEENLKNVGSRIVYCADELYLKAELEIPDSDYYEDYPQYENGVGMLRSFCDDFYRDFDDTKHPPSADGTLFTKEGREQTRKIFLVTGEAAYPTLKTLADDIVKRCGSLSCTVYAIKNNFFGDEITVAGLVTGRDIIDQLLPHKNNLGEELLIPAVMLRYERDLFLDNTSVRDIENALEIKARIVENNAEDFIKAVLNI
ncbi:MAG: DUF512 domain-containing protein [Oscillospiraceae bacterium]|nr:DUF512 domain-containing protein [Oscillospiraceae bacterium]